MSGARIRSRPPTVLSPCGSEAGHGELSHLCDEFWPESAVTLAATASCAACLCDLEEPPSSRSWGAPPLLYTMPCCAAALHASCLARCLQLRAIRKTCPGCQTPFPESLLERVLAAQKESAQQERHARQVTLAAVARGERLFTTGGGEVS